MPNAPSYDAIVLGTGGIGSAAILECARRGLTCLGIDRHPAAHALGSSHGQTRIIRQAYFEHPDYVPLARAAYGWWEQLMESTAQTVLKQLFTKTGLLQIGPAEGQVLAGVRRSALQHQLPVQDLSSAEIADRWPGAYGVPDGCEGVFEKNAGYLRVEACVQAHLNEAQRLGAELHFEEPVLNWQLDGDAVRVTTAAGNYTAARLMIAAGAWSGPLLGSQTTPDLQLLLPLVIRRKPQYWFSPADERYSRARSAPAVLFELPNGVFYAFPEVEGMIKVAEHSGGEIVPDPATVSRELESSGLQRVEEFCRTHLPGVTQKLVRHSVCMYTLTPDEHFVIDRHPQAPQVAFAAGMSGHGFKFSGVLGRALVELATSGRSALPIDFLNCRRPALEIPRN